MALEESCKLPKHIAFIMDGNGRWAKKRALPRSAGHVAGAKVFLKIMEYCGEIGINVITVYAFSTENWKRSDEEVGGLMRLFDEYLEIFRRDIAKRDVSIHFIGDISRFPQYQQDKMRQLEQQSAGKKICLNVAVNYGGRSEITNAVTRLLASRNAEGSFGPVTEEELGSYMYTAGLPDPDLIFRTGGDFRISNFLLWQSAYSELYFTDVLWPDLKPEDIDRALRVYGGTERRFGGV